MPRLSRTAALSDKAVFAPATAGNKAELAETGGLNGLAGPETLPHRRFLALERLPHLWCPGCGHGIILKAMAMVFEELRLRPDQVLLANGIGCSGRAGDYVSCHRFQGTHGRTLAFATGIKAARPDLTIICFMGDGDCGAIGGNHLLHAARRNLDVTAVVANNFNYGMTGGQFSPLTPLDSVTSTSRTGSTEAPLDICAVARAAGAAYVARTTAYHVAELRRYLQAAIRQVGFSLVEVLTPCPTYYGRYNRHGSPTEMLAWLRDNTLPLEKYWSLDQATRQPLLWRGVLKDEKAGQNSGP